MRHQRLFILCALIAAASVWLYFALPREPARRPVAAPAKIEKPTPAPPPPREVAKAAPAEPPPALPPTVPIAPLVVPPGDEPPHEEAVPAEEEEAAEEELPKTPPIDPDHAADLFADLLAKQEEEKEEAGNSSVDFWKRFSQETADEAWSTAATPKIQGTVDEWVNALPEDVGDHIAVVHVECRASLCQILIADNDMDSLSARAESKQEWSSASDVFLKQAWWSESGFTGKAYHMTPSDDGYALTTMYLTRGTEKKPSP